MYTRSTILDTCRIEALQVMGIDVIGMTLFPEVALSRELELCYVTLAMVTDYDVWAERPVSTDEIIETMSGNIENFKRLVTDTIPKIPCCQAL